MNLANVRQRYFDGENHIKTTVRNINPSTNLVDPSTTFDDSVLIILCDSGTITNLPTSQLVTFTDLTTINDPNVSGLSTTNQFNTNNVTGSTPYNATGLVNKQINWIGTGGTVQNGILKLSITENGKEYKFKGGVEYFQVLTGGTIQQFSGITNTTGGLLNKYLFQKTHIHMEVFLRYHHKTNMFSQLSF